MDTVFARGYRQAADDARWLALDLLCKKRPMEEILEAMDEKAKEVSKRDLPPETSTVYLDGTTLVIEAHQHEYYLGRYFERSMDGDSWHYEYRIPVDLARGRIREIAEVLGYPGYRHYGGPGQPFSNPMYLHREGRHYVFSASGGLDI